MIIVPIITRRADLIGNPGDVFISMGLQHLVKRTLPNAQFVLLDKHSSSDFMEYSSILKQKTILYAGMPQYNNFDEWCFWYDYELYRDILIPYKTKVISIAGGSGSPRINETPEEFTANCLSSQKTRNLLLMKKHVTPLSLVRDEHAYHLLKAYELKTDLLPCTALWALDYLGQPQERSNVVGLVLPGISHINPALLNKQTKEEVINWFKVFYAKLQSELAKMNLNTIVIAHTWEDYVVWGNQGYFTNSVYELLEKYTQLAGVISCRLHGAIPIAGQNKPAVYLGIDSRWTAAEIAGVPTLKLRQDLSVEEVITAYKKQNSSMITFKQDIASKYQEYLNAYLL